MAGLLTAEGSAAMGVWNLRSQRVDEMAGLIRDPDQQLALTSHDLTPQGADQMMNFVYHCCKRATLLPDGAYHLKNLLNNIQTLQVDNKRILPPRSMGSAFSPFALVAPGPQFANLNVFIPLEDDPSSSTMDAINPFVFYGMKNIEGHSDSFFFSRIFEELDPEHSDDQMTIISAQLCRYNESPMMLMQCLMENSMPLLSILSASTSNNPEQPAQVMLFFFNTMRNTPDAAGDVLSSVERLMPFWEMWLAIGGNATFTTNPTKEVVREVSRILLCEWLTYVYYILLQDPHEASKPVPGSPYYITVGYMAHALLTENQNWGVSQRALFRQMVNTIACRIYLAHAIHGRSWWTEQAGGGDTATNSAMHIAGSPRLPVPSVLYTLMLIGDYIPVTSWPTDHQPLPPQVFLMQKTKGTTIFPNGPPMFREFEYAHLMNSQSRGSIPQSLGNVGFPMFAHNDVWEKWNWPHTLQMVGSENQFPTTVEWFNAIKTAHGGRPVVNPLMKPFRLDLDSLCGQASAGAPPTTDTPTSLVPVRGTPFNPVVGTQPPAGAPPADSALPPFGATAAPALTAQGTGAEPMNLDNNNLTAPGEATDGSSSLVPFDQAAADAANAQFAPQGIVVTQMQQQQQLLQASQQLLALQNEFTHQHDSLQQLIQEVIRQREAMTKTSQELVEFRSMNEARELVRRQEMEVATTRTENSLKISVEKTLQDALTEMQRNQASESEMTRSNWAAAASAMEQWRQSVVNEIDKMRGENQKALQDIAAQATQKQALTSATQSQELAQMTAAVREYTARVDEIEKRVSERAQADLDLVQRKDLDEVDENIHERLTLLSNRIEQTQRILDEHSAAFDRDVYGDARPDDDEGEEATTEEMIQAAVLKALKGLMQRNQIPANTTLHEILQQGRESTAERASIALGEANSQAFNSRFSELEAKLTAFIENDERLSRDLLRDWSEIAHAGTLKAVADAFAAQNDSTTDERNVFRDELKTELGRTLRSLLNDPDGISASDGTTLQEFMNHSLRTFDEIMHQQAKVINYMQYFKDPFTGSEGSNFTRHPLPDESADLNSAVKNLLNSGGISPNDLRQWSRTGIPPQGIFNTAWGRQMLARNGPPASAATTSTAAPGVAAKKELTNAIQVFAAVRQLMQVHQQAMEAYNDPQAAQRQLARQRILSAIDRRRTVAEQKKQREDAEREQEKEEREAKKQKQKAATVTRAAVESADAVTRESVNLHQFLHSGPLFDAF